ncbi:hypothetical protein [Nocardia sp. NPDC057272]|uniref:hypothetical protein n=1 Tax=Nocardia sp. NPDC057272 TaxID=3346079 RepID=UPI003630F0F0
MHVIEDIMIMGAAQPLRSVRRDEQLLLAPPHPAKVALKLWSEHPALTVVHFPQEYRAQPFAPPRAVYESDHLRVEWQTMDNRQPFYHRNCDVDEISYQVGGERTLMTEQGVIEHHPGEFSRIPRGVAHDNYGRRESHLLFYVPAPVRELTAGIRQSQPLFPPFPGWSPSPWNEAITQCMGARGHDVTVFPIDEQLLLDRVHEETDRMQVLRGSGSGVDWLYGNDRFRLGVVAFGTEGETRRYRRNLDADEIHYQISGTRTLISQRGTVELGPGDFVRIPLGIAYTTVSTGAGEYISLLSSTELPQVAQTDRTAQPLTTGQPATAKDHR